MDDCRPSLIVVTGRPGSGKSTLAPRLAEAIRCPLISRDQILEGIVRTLGRSSAIDRTAAAIAYPTFFDTIALLLAQRVTLVAEAAFQHKLWAPKLEPLKNLAHIRIILCCVDPKIAEQRYLQRAASDPRRVDFHPGPISASDAYDPPNIETPILRVDTSGEYQPTFDEIIAFARLER